MKYFAYGSNMLIERLKERVSSAEKVKTYALNGYKLRFHKKSKDCSGKCNIVKASDSDIVHGVIFDFNESQKGKLDEAEGKGNGYRDETMNLIIDDDSCKCLIYLAEPGYIDEALIPYRWYYDLVLAGAEQNELPKDYIAGLKAIPFTEDPKPDREAKLKAEMVLQKYRESRKK
jgi:gamma-glutamylcyclotransferase (GGCT)/AIG2-like uncharacterized protein YtfP